MYIVVSLHTALPLVSVLTKHVDQLLGGPFVIKIDEFIEDGEHFVTIKVWI